MATTSTPWRLAALSLVMLLPSLGTRIANVSLPSLSMAFNAPFGEVQWVVIGYLLAVTTLIVTAGRLGDLFGRRRPLLIGVGLFVVASAACAVAPNVWVLVLLRGAQGAGAALMMSLTVASVGDLVPREQTGSAIGLLGAVSAVGTALGPSLGGALIASLGWQAVFAFLAIAGLVALIAAYRLLPREVLTERKPFAFDVEGTALLVVALGAYALSTTIGPSTSGLVAAALVTISALSVIAFVIAESRVRAPLVRLELLRDAGLSTALLALGLVSAIVMSTLVVGPFYLGERLHLTPFTFGLVMTVGPMVAAIVGVPAGRIVDRFGSRGATLIGLIGVVVGSIIMAAMPGGWGVVGYGANLGLITAGYALFQAANNTAIIAHVAPDQRGLISGLIGLARNLGFITGASAMGAIFALGTHGVPSIGLMPGAETGMHVTFAASAALGLGALILSMWATMPRRPVTP